MSVTVKDIEEQLLTVAKKLQSVDPETADEFQKEFAQYLDVLKRSPSSEEAVQAAFVLGKLIGKAIMACKMAKISRILINM